MTKLGKNNSIHRVKFCNKNKLVLFKLVHFTLKKGRNIPRFPTNHRFHLFWPNLSPFLVHAIHVNVFVVIQILLLFSFPGP